MRLTDEPRTSEIMRWWKMSEAEMKYEIEKLSKELSYRMLSIKKFDDPYEIRNRIANHLQYINEIAEHKFDKKVWLNDDTYEIELKPLSEINEENDEQE